MTSQTHNEHWAITLMLWLRHEFGKWFAGTTILLIAWVIAGAAIWVGVHWDMDFAVSIMPEGGNEKVYQIAGATISLACVFGLALCFWAWRMGSKWSSAGLLLIWTFCTVASYSHAIGVNAQRFESQYVVATALEAAQDQPEVNREARQEQLEAARARIIADRDAEIAPLNERAQRLEDDGVDGIGSGERASIESYQQRIDAILAEYRPRIQAIDDQMLALLTPTDAVAQTDIVEGARETQKFNPLFSMIAGRDDNGNVREGAARWLSKAFAIFWPSLITLLGVLPAILLNLHSAAAARRPEYSMGNEASYEINGETLSEDEISEAVEQRRRRKEAAQKAAETRKTNAQREEVLAFLDADPWKLQMHDRIWGMHLSGMPASEIAQSVGWTPQEFENNLRILFFPDQIEAINAVRKDGGSLDVAAE